MLCLSCQHSKPPCAAAAGACGSGCAHDAIVCRVKMNDLTDDYDYDPYTCKYYLPVFLKIR